MKMQLYFLCHTLASPPMDESLGFTCLPLVPESFQLPILREALSTIEDIWIPEYQALYGQSMYGTDELLKNDNIMVLHKGSQILGIVLERAFHPHCYIQSKQKYFAQWPEEAMERLRQFSTLHILNHFCISPNFRSQKSSHFGITYSLLLVQLSLLWGYITNGNGSISYLRKERGVDKLVDHVGYTNLADTRIFGVDCTLMLMSNENLTESIKKKTLSNQVLSFFMRSNYDPSRSLQHAHEIFKPSDERYSLGG